LGTYLRNIAYRLLDFSYVRASMTDKTRLSDIEKVPPLRLFLGISLIFLSYVTCWPLIGVLSMVAVKSGNHWIIGLGGPTAYLFSHLLFIMGVYFAGSQYIQFFLRRATRKAVIKILGPSSAFTQQPPGGP